MTAKELREKYIDFFVSKGHAVIGSAPLVPENDPTVLFTTAGMHPLVPFLLGHKHPQGKRLVNCQKCIRTGDIDEVGDRFNVITNPLLHRDKKDTNKDFVGLPVPAAAFTVASLVLFLLHLAENDRSLHRWAIALPPLLGLIAVLMVSTVRYPSGKNINLQTKTRVLPFVAFLVFLGGLALFKEIALMAVALGYIFFGLIRHWRRPIHRQKPPPFITPNSV